MASKSKMYLLRQILLDPQMHDVQTMSIICLLQLGYDGVKTLIELASKDFSSAQPAILSHLVQVRSIQRLILVPAILS